MPKKSQRSHQSPDDAKAVVSALLERAAACPPFAERLDRLDLATPENPVAFDHVAEAGQPFYAALTAQRWLADSAAANNHGTPIVWIACPHVKLQEIVHAELPVWGVDAAFLPEYEWVGFEDVIPDPESAAERLATLQRLWEKRASGKPQVVVLCRGSFEEAAPKPGSLSDQSLRLSVGDTHDPVALAEQLTQAGYEKEAQVFQRGQFAVRGGIVDVFSWQSTAPVRLELFGDEIDSIREFDVDEQTSVRKLESTEILLSEANLEPDATLEDYLDEKADLVIAIEPDAEESIASVNITSTSYSYSSSSSYSKSDDKEEEDEEYDEEGESYAVACYENPLGVFEAGDFILQEQRRHDFAQQMAEWENEGWNAAMAFNSQGEIDRFRELVYSEHLDSGILRTIFGSLSRGFTIPEAKIAILCDAEIFGRYQHQRTQRRMRLAQQRQVTQRQASLSEFNYGDLVVHADYGIGKFKGIRDRETDTRDGAKREEVLEIEYADEARLFVPLDQAHLVSRYVGTGKKAPKLSRLGDKRWSRIRKDAERSILDYAARLLSVQAERQTHTGFSHPPDNKWQWEFENAFIYKETPDQLRAIEDAKEDMESDRPMDRLVCGDVGFGKTEVAIRAAFKAVMSGKQVAMLAPTTVLADQHYHNFRERMSDFPVTIELLSRYRTAAQQRQTLEKMANGSVDIVIGTHRLISKDVRYKDLGLVVIDEEQRFGVQHKERFKEMFRLVDVLTLSATPIPRTLYLSLMGVMNMSTIETPPPNRYPVSTSVCPYDERTIRAAIQKELARQGQVFFLHNRVKTIRGMKKRIEDLVPGARVEVGHGQMDDDELEEVMNRFIRQEIDVLVCTTIIESGVDIPNANTIIIDRADRFGLADLYQLRGRVGRADRRAYAYLMLPRDMLTVGDARKRINAIKQYSSLGAGLKIEMRDLEIRGAGNLLGTQQSGHIAAIGFDLYCQLLKQSVGKLKGEPVGDRIDIACHVDFLATNEAQYQRAPKGTLPAFIPANYMPEARLRITAYRHLAEASRLSDLENLRKNWQDRFGKLPDAAEFLLLATELKIRAAHQGVGAVEIRDDKLMLTKKGKYLQINGRFPRLEGKSQARKLRHAVELVMTLS
ncbi:MAG: transcription-repair coupling factor [Verrucomicrobiae bacterium]|nr:transcription-repair coupling factor [Verrucomicrobiae bacterium]